MSILGLVVSLALVLIAIVVVARPFFGLASKDPATGSNLQLQRERVSRYYERVLSNIRDLDEDFQTGKIADAEYRDEREVWVDRGVRLLRVADSLDTQQSLVSAGAANADDIDRAIESAVQAIRDGKQSSFHDLPDDGARA